MAERPLPLADIDSAPYWQAAKEHKLQLPRCTDCGTYAFPPRTTCNRCLSTNMVWTELSGRGSIYTYCVMHDTLIRGMVPPFVIAQVELEEQPGLRLTCNILECPIDQVRIGMAVEVTYEDVTEEVTLPQFRAVT
jgi:uncharacterized OB-fold protein